MAVSHSETPRISATLSQTKIDSTNNHRWNLIEHTLLTIPSVKLVSSPSTNAILPPTCMATEIRSTGADAVDNSCFILILSTSTRIAFVELLQQCYCRNEEAEIKDVVKAVGTECGVSVRHLSTRLICCRSWRDQIPISVRKNLAVDHGFTITAPSNCTCRCIWPIGIASMNWT